MDKVRDIDVDHFLQNGEIWVRAGTGGVSTFSRRGSIDGKWWRLDSEYDYGVLLVVWNDVREHWSWEPRYDMTLEAYKAALRLSHRSFHRIQDEQ